MRNVISNARETQSTAPCNAVRSNIKHHSVDEDEFEYSAPCPICEKRTIDISELPDKLVRLRLKCPHCRKIVKIPLSRAPP